MQQAASVDQNPIPWRSISTNWQNVRQPWLRPSPFNVAGIMPHRRVRRIDCAEFGDFPANSDTTATVAPDNSAFTAR